MRIYTQLGLDLNIYILYMFVRFQLDTKFFSLAKYKLSVQVNNTNINSVE